MENAYTAVDGHSIRYIDTCTPGRPVVLLHGLGGFADKWGRVISMISSRFRVVVPDMIGYGLSDKPVTDYTPAFFVSFLQKFVAAAGLDRPHLVGASLGGQVAAEYAADNTDGISKLILVSPAGIMKHSTPALDSYISAALYPRESSVSHALQLMEGSDRRPNPRLIDSFIANMKRPNAKMAFMSSLLCFKNHPDITPALRRITAPTLLVWGHEDPIIPVSYAGRFTAAIPNCKFIGMNNCGHTPYVQYSRRFADMVIEFLESDP